MMNADQWLRVDSLFKEALSLPEADRASFLASACGDDARVYAEVSSLLAHHDQAEHGFMRSPFIPLERSESTPLPQIPGFEIERVIASGGMATVYEAVQDRPHRTVAIKVPHTTFVSRSAVRRFEFESQVLASLRHPHIAQVFEVGTFQDRDAAGPRAPYFAMEYVPDAARITDYASTHGLTARQRLSLFLQACDAVHHGHQRGIIHRDLKPGNVLVDSSGFVKIIDFGVARAIDSDMALTTVQTDVGALVGTVQYMSPEQCDADPHNLDTRSDVYSLGVVLYELLTGALPYDAAGSTIYHSTRVIKEDAPRRLSSINPKLRGDVETIVLKALEKDRDRRYQSVAELAEDLRRYLGNLPIVARPPSFTYQAGKFVGRHKWQTAAFVAATACLVATSIIALVSRHAAELRKAGEQTEAHAYGTQMGSVEAALQMHDTASARSILFHAKKEPSNWEWRHLASRVDQCIATVVDDSVELGDIAVAPTRDLVAVCPFTGSVDVFDVKTGELLRSFPGRLPIVANAAFSPDGTILATMVQVPNQEGGKNTLLRLWNVDGPAPIAEVETDKAGGALAFHPRKLILAAGFGDGTIEVWDLRELPNVKAGGASIRLPPSATLSGHAQSVSSIAFSATAPLLASGSDDYTVRLWDFEAALSGSTESAKATLRGHTYYVRDVAFSPDGSRLASASIDKTIRLWDVQRCLAEAVHDADKVATKSVIDTLYGHQEGVTAVVFDRSGRRLISGGGDRLVCIWDVNEDAVVPDYGRARNWAVPHISESATLRGHEDWIRGLSVLSRGHIISSSRDGTVKLWLADVEDVPKLRGHTTSVDSVAFVQNGRFIISVGGDCLIVWDADLCLPVARRYPRAGEAMADLASWLTDDQRMVAVATKKEADSIEPGGRILLWNLDNRNSYMPERSIQPLDRNDSFASICVSADGRRLAAGTVDGSIRLWNIAELQDIKPLPSLSGHSECVNDLLFLDERGAWLASASGEAAEDGGVKHTIRLWNVESAEQSGPTLTDHSGRVAAIALHPDGSTLASASDDGTVGLWSVTWRRSRPVLRLDALLSGHTDRVLSVAFHPTEPRLASGSGDRTVRIWDLNSKVQVAELRGPVGSIGDLAFNAQGTRLASTSRGFLGTDNVIWLWDSEIPRELRAQRAVATRAYAEVRQRFQRAAATIDEIRQDVELSEHLADDVRSIMLSRFDDFLPSPYWLHKRAESALAGDANPTETEYRQALGWARAAVEAAPENVEYRTTQAMLHYRLQEYEQALATLDQPDSLKSTRLPDYWAALALVHNRLGNIDASVAAKNRLVELLKGLDGPVPGIYRRFSEEALNSFGASGPRSIISRSYNAAGYTGTTASFGGDEE